MADEETKPEEGAAPPAKSKKKLIIIIVAVVLLLGIGVGAFFALKGGKSADEEGAQASEEETAAGAEGEAGSEEGLPGGIVPLDTFIVNLQVKGSFLKTSIQLELGQPEPPKEFENDVPKIRDAIIRVLSSKTAAEILSVEGKDKLRDEVRHAVNDLLGTELVSQVYFTEFIVQ